jgi:uncharacterized protein
MTGALVETVGVADDARHTVSRIVDCDVHNSPKPGELGKYLPARWHRYLEQMQGRGRAGLTVGARPQGLNREDTVPPSGGRPATDLGFLRSQLLDEYNVTRGVLSSLESFKFSVQHGELGLALARAMNDWQADAWLDQEERLSATITIPQEDGVRAAEEIARVNDADPRFVGVFMTILTREPVGHSKYWPIFAECAQRNLPLFLHVGGWSGTQMAAGWPTMHLDSHSTWPQAYATQAISLVYSGAFVRYPNLKVVMEEGGLGWLPSTLWRLDRAWETMGEDVPHLVERPSETLRRHLWLTTQPLEETGEPEQLIELFDQIDMDDHILFATDYPHHDFDSPRRAIPALLGTERRRKIFYENADALLRFPSDG